MSDVQFWFPLLVRSAMFNCNASMGEAEDEESFWSRTRSMIKDEHQTLIEKFEQRFHALEAWQEQLEHGAEDGACTRWYFNKHQSFWRSKVSASGTNAMQKAQRGQMRRSS